MNVLSLFGGAEAGRMALEKLGIVPTAYFSAEFDPYPVKLSSANYPSITHIGSVTEVRYSDGRLETANGSFDTTIDWLIGGPPCQDLSIAGKRAGLEGSRSSLFWEYVRILNEVKPKFFLVENVASMPKEAKETMTQALFGISPVLINSALVSAQNRKRLFWVGKRNEDGTYSKVEISQPKDRGIVLKDILEPIPLTDERWKPLDTKYIEAVSKRIAGWSDNKNRLIAYQSDAKRSTEAEHVYIKEEGKTDSCTVAHVPKTVIGQFRRTDLRVHSDQENSPTLTANMGTGGNNVPVVIEQYQIPHGTNPGGLRDGDKAQTVTANGQYVYNNQVVGLAHRNRGEGKEPECNGTEKANSITSVQSDSEVLYVSEEPKYYWRKLTVRECARIQTFPETYSFDSVSASRAYKAIGNSWTVDVIAHIFQRMLNVK